MKGTSKEVKTRYVTVWVIFFNLNNFITFILWYIPEYSRTPKNVYQSYLFSEHFPLLNLISKFSKIAYKNYTFSLFLHVLWFCSSKINIIIICNHSFLGLRFEWSETLVIIHLGIVACIFLYLEQHHLRPCLRTLQRSVL